MKSLIVLTFCLTVISCGEVTKGFNSQEDLDINSFEARFSYSGGPGSGVAHVVTYYRTLPNVKIENY